jgi:hypothetical protein
MTLLFLITFGDYGQLETHDIEEEIAYKYNPASFHFIFFPHLLWRVNE